MRQRPAHSAKRQAASARATICSGVCAAWSAERLAPGSAQGMNSSLAKETNVWSELIATREVSG
jgi:hypothetical protein